MSSAFLQYMWLVSGKLQYQYNRHTSLQQRTLKLHPLSSCGFASRCALGGVTLSHRLSGHEINEKSTKNSYVEVTSNVHPVENIKRSRSGPGPTPKVRSDKGSDLDLCLEVRFSNL